VTPGRILEKWCPYRETPNSSARDPGEDVRAVVVHYTGGGSLGSTAKWICDPSSGVSYHVMIERDGRAVQFVDFHRKAWHAGVGNIDGGQDKRNANVGSIGVAFCNYGKICRADTQPNKLVYTAGAPVLHSNAYWEPYTDEALATFTRVLTWFERTGWTTNLVRHSEIALPRGRKHDPGPLFSLYI